MHHSCCLLWSLSIALSLTPIIKVKAQLIPDNTLGKDNSTVNTVNSVDSLKRIDGGAIRGSNLFHSFKEFNIDNGKSVYFSNPSTIENILTRVTGNNPSSIFGKLGVLGNANLFLINPNGIIFGNNASLDINGSFTGTTSPSILFNNNFEFSATLPRTPPLLTINLIPGLQYASQPIGDINHSGNLTVNSGKNISLFGNTVTNTGNLTAPGGIISILGNRISLADNARIDVSSSFGGGSILVGGEFQGMGNTFTAKRTFVGSDVNINADAINLGNGGDVIIWSDEVTGFYGNISARGGSLGGNGGKVEVSGKQHLIFRGNVDTFAPIGKIGTLLLDPTNIIIANGSGDISGDGEDNFIGDNNGISGSVLSLPISQIEDTSPTTIYESELENLSGDTNIVLQASNNITIENLADDELNLSPGTGSITFIANTDGGQIGNFTMEDTSDTILSNGRDIEISGQELILGNINTSNTGLDAGAIKLNATKNIFTQNLISESVSETRETGNGGAIILNSGGNISTQDILSNSESDVGESRNGGIVTLSAAGDISTKDIISDSFSEAGSTGNGGTITITAGANISTKDLDSSSFSTGGDAENGGQINLKAGENISTEDVISSSFSEIGNSGNGAAINFTAGSNITVFDVLSDSYAEVGSAGDADAITFTAGGNIFLQEVYSTSVARAGNAGNGGAIAFTAGGDIIGNNTVIATFSISDTQNSGNGGNVTLEAQQTIKDLEVFTLSSDFISGAVEIKSKGDLSLENTNILTSKKLIIDYPWGEPVTLDVGKEGESGNVTVTSNGNLSFNNTLIQSDTIGDNPAGNVNITSSASIAFNNSIVSSNTASTGAAGNIDINAINSVILDNNSQITAEAKTVGDAGTVSINTDNLTIKNQSLIQTSSNSGFSGDIQLQNLKQLQLENSRIVANTDNGTAGNITIKATDLVEISDNSKIASEADEFGVAGELEITTNQFQINNNSQASVSSQGNGISGGVLVNASNINLFDNAKISATTESGYAGNIQVNATDSIKIENASKLESQATVEGIAGFIEITTNKLNIERDSQTTVSSRGTGNAGYIEVNASDVNLTNGGEISATTESGASGNITLNDLNSLRINDSKISASTINGEAGTLAINATNSIQLTEKASLSVQANNGGIAGSIEINTNQFDISDASKVSVSSPKGVAGNLEITANNLFLNQGILTAETGSSEGQTGANISLNIQDLLIMSNNSLISAQAFDNANGGNINIYNPEGFIIGLPFENSDIIANASQGNGGNIDIITQNILGLQFRKQRTPKSDITASSRFGVTGQVTVDQLSENSAYKLLNLPSTPTENAKIQPGCSTSSGSNFVISGRGGLPQSPNDVFDGNTNLVELVDATLTRKIPTTTSSINSKNTSQASVDNQKNQIIEATGWIKDADGNVIFIAQSPNVHLASC